jgi:uncharacterized protein (DUF305 family)
MIPHHQQAIDMAALAKDRTNLKELLDAAGRIDASQKDEIEFMQKWLAERNEQAPAAADHAAHMGGMKGMATPEQMAALAAANGTDFDRLFLTLMIKHHDGAVQMVEDLTEQPGSAYEPALFEFTRDVTNDQNAEIERMNALLVKLSSDPRASLKPGFDDAGEAILNLTKVASVPKPPGFFDPKNPANLPPKRLAALAAAAAGEKPETDANAAEKKDEPSGGGNTGGGNNNRDPRSPLLSFANTDLAFRGDVMVAGSYHGFNIYRLGGSGAPQLLSSVVCPGGQGDVSIVGDLLIMSVEQTRGRVDCGLEGVEVDATPERFRGLRIFDIPTCVPKQVSQVQTRARNALRRHKRQQDHRLQLGTAACAEGLGGPSAPSPATRARRSFASTSSRSRCATRRAHASSIRPPCSRIPRPASWPASGAAATTATTRRRRARRISATTSRCFRRPASPRVRARATASCSTSAIR